jgi:hypothetical protein
VKPFALAAVVLAAPLAAGQELWHMGAPINVYGLYFMVPVQSSSTGTRVVDQQTNGSRVVFDAPDMNVNAKVEKMIGRVDAKVADVVYKGYACKHYVSSFELQPPAGIALQPVQRRIESWIDFKGNVKRVKTFYRDKRKLMEVDAEFVGDTIEMSLNDNGVARKLSLNPAQGVEAFKNPVPELIANATKDRYEKTWSVIDPATAGIVTYTFRLKGRFVPFKSSSSKVKGWTFEVQSPTGTHNVAVTDEGALWQVEYADTSILRAVPAIGIGG